VSGSRARDDEIARLRDKIVELERQLQAVRASVDGAPAGDLHSEIIRQQRQAEELGRLARLVNEGLDLRSVSERLAEGSSRRPGLLAVIDETLQGDSSPDPS
jgi:Viral A-type inclusion protein repeat